MPVKKLTLPHSPTLSGISAAFLLIGLLTLLVPSNVLAAPKGPGGQSCKSSGTTTVNGKEEGTGRDMKCTADYCKYDECETSGRNVGKCYEKTHYSNVRDCKPAASRQNRPNTHMAPGSQGTLMTPSTRPTRPMGKAFPRTQAPIMKRGVEPEAPDSLPTEQEEIEK